jgi:hypothetical protein
MSLLQHAQWNPNTSAKNDERISHNDKPKYSLVSVNAIVLEVSMHPEQGIKVMQVGIVSKFVGKGMMGVRVLVLPQHGVGQQTHTPDTDIINPGCPTHGKVTCIVTRRSNQPSSNSQSETTENDSLCNHGI